MIVVVVHEVDQLLQANSLHILHNHLNEFNIYRILLTQHCEEYNNQHQTVSCKICIQHFLQFLVPGPHISFA